MRLICYRLIVCMGFLAFMPMPAHAQQIDALSQQASDLAKQEFQSRWLPVGDKWYLYYEVPQNPFAPVLGQGVVRGYGEAGQVVPQVAQNQLNAADFANGLRWQGRVTFTAIIARQYDFSLGWQPWVNQPILMYVDLELRNNQWRTDTHIVNPQLPGWAKIRRPEAGEIPGPNEGPRASATPDVQQSRACAVGCGANDGFCTSVVGKMTELNACHGSGDDGNLYNRFRDAGYYFCQQGQTADTALRGFEQIRRPANQIDSTLDQFAIQLAPQYLCGKRPDHAGQPDPTGQAKSDFETALKVTIDNFRHNRNGLFEIMRDAGFFYCSVKQDMPYDSTIVYEANVSDHVQYAARFLAVRSPLTTTREILMRHNAMSTADKYLCPGWPGHPRPEQ
jgi:hypothetical protein